MKKLTISTKEFMLLKQLANQFSYSFEHSYNTSSKLVEVSISKEFCEAFGW